MSRVTCVALLSLATVLALRADETTDAHKVVERAVESIGGAKRLTELRAGVWKTSGTVKGRPSQADFSGQLPGKFRIDSTRVVEGKKTRHSRIVDGDRGWVVEGDQARPMEPAEIADVKASFYHKQVVTTLLPLRERGVRLRVTGKAVRDGKAVTHIEATRKGYPTLLLTFDDRAGLLVRSEMTIEVQRTKKARKVVLELSHHKEFSGITMPGRTRTFHDGELFLDTETVEFTPVANLPEKTFRPDEK